EERLQFGREEQPAAFELREEQRLLAESVAGQEQSTRVVIPDGEGKHAVQVSDASLAPLEVGREQHLGIARRAKCVAAGFELFAQLPVVVDFAVEDQGGAAVRVHERLVGGGAGVENGKPSVG